MTAMQIFSILQLMAILSGTIFCLIATRKSKTNEYKYLVPYCILNVFAMLILGAVEFMTVPIPLIFATMYFFACCEVFFLPNYIASIIGVKKNVYTQITICIVAFILSRIITQNATSVLYLVANLYITLYVCRYFLWLFKNNENLILSETPHYWIIMGICVCYTGSIPYFISEIIIFKFKGFQLYNQIASMIFIMYIVLNICMFVLFIKAFLCMIKHQKSLSGL
ncbi:MAG: hypothetical protein A1D16_09770 [Flavihumibacter sp. CACIAM 22H1]|nr:MAG: hypothetical protein A1D16_09770 [Flavihumibacter sp. CACIAM 22H1]